MGLMVSSQVGDDRIFCYYALEVLPQVRCRSDLTDLEVELVAYKIKNLFVFFCFFLKKHMYNQHIYIMYISNIFTICTYLHIYTTSPHFWGWWCTCWAATTGPRWNSSESVQATSFK